MSWRGVGFPQDLSIISQHESAIALRPGNRWSLLEANIWGMRGYAIGIGEEREQYRGIHTPHFLGYILVSVEHVARIMRAGIDDVDSRRSAREISTPSFFVLSIVPSDGLTSDAFCSKPILVDVENFFHPLFLR